MPSYHRNALTSNFCAKQQKCWVFISSALSIVFIFNKFLQTIKTEISDFCELLEVRKCSVCRSLWIIEFRNLLLVSRNLSLVWFVKTRVPCQQILNLRTYRHNHTFSWLKIHFSNTSDILRSEYPQEVIYTIGCLVQSSKAGCEAMQAVDRSPIRRLSRKQLQARQKGIFPVVVLKSRAKSERQKLKKRAEFSKSWRRRRRRRTLLSPLGRGCSSRSSSKPKFVTRESGRRRRKTKENLGPLWKPSKSEFEDHLW